MGFVEAWVREKPIRAFITRLAQRRAEAAAAAAAAADGDASIPQLSSIANSVVSRCSRILDIATENLQRSFENDFPDNFKEQATYSRELLEYCCHKALHEVTTRPDYLTDKNLCRLMFDMMLAWQSPGAQDEFLVNSSTSFNSHETEDEDEGSIFYANSTRLAIQVGDNKTVGLSAFARIAPACPIIADLVTVHNLFDALTSSSGGQLHFLVYDKYLKSLDM